MSIDGCVGSGACSVVRPLAELGVDGDGQPDLASEDGGQRVLELPAQPALELGPREVVGHGDDGGVAVERDGFARLDPGLLVGLQLVDHALPGGRQVRIVVHRVVPLSSFARTHGRRRPGTTTGRALRSTGLSTPCERDRLLVETVSRDVHGGPAETGSPQVRGPEDSEDTDCDDPGTLVRPERGETRRGSNITPVARAEQDAIHRLSGPDGTRGRRPVVRSISTADGPPVHAPVAI